MIQRHTFDFLKALVENNNREWFQANKKRHDEARENVIEFTGELLKLLHKIDPAIDDALEAKKCVMRIYRDIRFSGDKSPFKTQVAAWWSRSGLEKTSGGGFYFHVSATEITIAAGVYMPEREQLLAIRRYLVDHHDELRSLLAGKKLKSMMQEFDGQKLTRPPKGFAADDLAMDLLLCRQWGLSARLPLERAMLPTLKKDIVDRFKIAAPVVAFLNRPLAGKPKQPIF